MLASRTWNFLCHKTGKGLLKHWITTYFISYLCAVLQYDLKLTHRWVDPSCGLGLNETRAAIKIPNKKQRWDNRNRNKGWERSCVDWLFQLASPDSSPLSSCSFSPQLILSHACFPLQTCSSDRASQLGSAESLALLCRRDSCTRLSLPPHPQGHGSSPLPSAFSWWAWGPQSCPAMPPLKSPGAALNSCSLPWSLAF